MLPLEEIIAKNNDLEVIKPPVTGNEVPRSAYFRGEKIKNYIGAGGTWIESIKFLLAPRNPKRRARVWVPETGQLETIHLGLTKYVQRNGRGYHITEDENGRFTLVPVSVDVIDEV